MMEELINKTLGHYKVLKLLGEGGMGTVYKGIDITLQREVAIKVMHPHIARTPNFRERFLQEARIAARLQHVNIVQVYDFGQEGSLLYIVMRFIAGDNLEGMLRSLRAQKKWITLDETLQVVRQIALALDYVHKQGVLHRDVKPGNIMITPDPGENLLFRPVLTDLGLAKLVEGGMVTQEGTSMGTPAYMSPEQALGQNIDSRSDVYSLGVLLYELCVGQLPFPAKTISQAIHYHTTEKLPAPRSIRTDLPQAVEAMILKAMEKKPEDRFSDAAVLAKALQECLQSLPGDLQEVATELDTVSLATEYQKSLVEERGTSIFDEFKTPPSLREDMIQILLADKSRQEVKIKPGGLTIGRAADNDIVLPDPKVSQHHARVEFYQGEYQVMDLNSTNGTYLANIKLLPGIPEKWTGNKALRIGGTWFRLLLAQKPATGLLRKDGTLVSSSSIHSSSDEGRVSLFVEETQLSVDPGQSVDFSITLLNQGATVDHFMVSLSGIPTHWIKLPATAVQLMPGEQGEVTLSIQPPRSPESRAGSYPITFSVRGQKPAGPVALAEMTLIVEPFFQFSSRLVPQKIGAGKMARINIENQGNLQDDFSLSFQDRDSELVFQPPQTRLKAKGGETVGSEFQALPRKRRWIGNQQIHPISVQVCSDKGELQTLAGEVVSRALIPTWMISFAAVLLVFLCAAAYFFLTPIKVPDVSGRTADQARSILAGQFLRVGPTQMVYDSDVDSGKIIRTEPEAGKEIRRGMAVNLIVSKGASTAACEVSIPDVTNLPESEARAKLENACKEFSPCLNPNNVLKGNPLPEGRVIETDPVRNTRVACGSSVTLFVSAGSQLDSDEDGMPDLWETKYGLDPINSSDATQDKDKDALINLTEYQSRTDPTNLDTDGDGMPDGWEVDHGLAPTEHDGAKDKDNDGLENLGEYGNHSDPSRPDTDDDGMKDGKEVQNGLDPNRNDAAEDLDKDCRTNVAELQDGTNPQDPEPWQVPVISRGASREQAASQITAACLSVGGEDLEISEDVSPGGVIGTKPAAGQIVPAHTAITLVISRGHACRSQFLNLTTPDIGYFYPPLVSGDREFGGNGPRVNVRVTLSVENNGIYALVYMAAQEFDNGNLDSRAQGDHKYHLVTPSVDPGWVVQLQGDTFDEITYIDNDLNLDVFPGDENKHKVEIHNYGEAGPVAKFEIMGDTEGDDILEKVGNTSVHVIFNTLTVKLVETQNCVSAANPTITIAAHPVEHMPGKTIDTLLLPFFGFFHRLFHQTRI